MTEPKVELCGRPHPRVEGVVCIKTPDHGNPDNTDPDHVHKGIDAESNSYRWEYTNE